MTTPLHIAVFSECYHPMRNGVVVSVASFTRQLTERGHQITIFTARHPEQPDVEPGVYRFPSILLPSRARYPIPLPVADWETRQVLKESPFDLIHSHGLMLMGHAGLQWSRRRQVPLVFTYHTLIEEYTHYIPLPQTMLRNRAVAVSRDYANEADHVIVPSAHVQRRLEDYGVTRPISVIPTGIDLAFIDAIAPGAARARYDIPADVPLLAYAGRLAHEKNLPRLLGAFRLVLEREPDAHLVLIGGGPFEAEAKELAEALEITPRTRFTGMVARDEVIQGLREADLFVFPSLSETQGLVIGEAMACGLPVVAVTSAAARDTFSHEAEGLLVPDTDDAFADAILALLHDPTRRATRGHRARLRAEGMSIIRCTDRLVAVYREVVG